MNKKIVFLVNFFILIIIFFPINIVIEDKNNDLKIFSTGINVIYYKNEHMNNFSEKKFLFYNSIKYDEYLILNYSNFSTRFTFSNYKIQDQFNKQQAYFFYKNKDGFYKKNDVYYTDEWLKTPIFNSLKFFNLFIDDFSFKNKYFLFTDQFRSFHVKPNVIFISNVKDVVHEISHSLIGNILLNTDIINSYVYKNRFIVTSRDGVFVLDKNSNDFIEVEDTLIESDEAYYLSNFGLLRVFHNLENSTVYLNKEIIESKNGYYSINSGYQIWTDWEHFESKTENLINEEASFDIKSLKNLFEFYRGDFFADLNYADWPEIYREELRQKYLNLIEIMTGKMYSANKYLDLLYYLNKGLDYDPYREKFYLLKLKALDKLEFHSPHQQNYYLLSHHYWLI